MQRVKLTPVAELAYRLCVRGTLRTGAVPSTREASRLAGVSQTTIVEALDELERAGLLSSDRHECGRRVFRLAGCRIGLTPDDSEAGAALSALLAGAV